MTQVVGGIPMRLCASSWSSSSSFVSRKRALVLKSTNLRKNVSRVRLVLRAVQSVDVDIRTEMKEIEAVAVRLARQVAFTCHRPSGNSCVNFARQGSLSWLQSRIEFMEKLDVSNYLDNFSKFLWAGALIREKSGRATQVDSKSTRSDLVTEVDKACEQLIQSEVKAVFPHHHWLGEETFTVDQLDRLGDGPAGSEWTWLVDPIDGTLNFIGGVPFASVSIAVAKGNNLQVGVVYNPFIDELFHAQKGQGAFLNGEAISALPHETELEDAIVTLGFTSKPERRVAMLQEITKVGPHCRAIRALGSAALHISYVAAGRVGCFFEYQLKPWDIAAAWLILEEAGGCVTQMNGELLPLVGGSILATNGGTVHKRMLELLEPAQPSQ